MNIMPICGSIIVRLANLQKLVNTTSTEIGLIYIAPGSGCMHLYLFSDPCICRWIPPFCFQTITTYRLCYCEPILILKQCIAM